MWNVLWRRTVLSCRRSLWGKALILLLGLFVGIGQAQAQTGCYRSRELQPDSPWSMVPSGTPFKNGDIVGHVSVSAVFTMPSSTFDTTVLIAQGMVPNNAYQAVPLTGMPGLGLIVRWVGYYGTVPLQVIGTPVASGTIISKQTTLPIMRARGSQSNYMIIQMYRFELVVIDAKIYKGGPLTFTEKNKVYVTTAQANGLGTPQMCMEGRVDVMDALTKTVAVPELPKPVLPTCKFSTGTLNQRVSLNSVGSSQLVPVGSARSLGTEGQNTFHIDASGCSKDTKLDVYFTDTRDNASTKDYVLTTNSAVGIRMFYQNEGNPIPFGSAPSGSWIPSRRAVSLGPAPAEGTSLNAKFTAQYVRLPNKAEADVKPGPLEAGVTFVVVYP